MAKSAFAHDASSLPSGDGLQKGLVASAVLHGVLFVFLAVRAVFYPNEPLETERAIRVDIVDLPRKAAPAPIEAPAAPSPAAPTPAAPATPAPEPAKAEIPPKSPEPNKLNLSKTKKSQADALKRLEALNRIEAAAKTPAAPAATTAPVRGSQLSAGQSLTGVAKMEFDGYLEGLDAHVKRHWSLPEWLAEAKLKAQAVVWLDARGNVTKKKLVKSSGNPGFDQRVMDAIEKSSPFPPPPDRLATIFAVDGVRLGFPE